MTLRTLVVDDEAPARDRLRRFLAHEPGVEIVGECASGPEAIACICQLKPDLVFLDVQMPQLTGIDVVRALPSGHQPAIVFVTAHDRYAVEAFNVQAIDYLLKPFNRVRLHETVRRARLRLEAVPAFQTEPYMVPVQNNPPCLNRFAVKDGNQVLFVQTQDVNYIEAAANYAVLCTPSKNYVLRETLLSLEKSLSPKLFLRISRSIIINLNRIRAIRMGLPGEWLVVLQNGRELPMTRGLKEIQERLQYSDT
jgi:two-component system, LytTR family, response regulator